MSMSPGGGQNQPLRPRPVLGRQAAAQAQEVHRELRHRQGRLHTGRCQAQEEEEQKKYRQI